MRIPRRHENRKEYIHAIFSSVAHRYDLMNSLLSLKQDEYWRRFAVSKTGLCKGGSALDVCCGTGKMLSELAMVALPQGDVVGIDFNKKMLRKAVDNLANGGLGCYVELIMGEATDLPFRNNSFDCATIGFGLRNIQDIVGAINEMRRVVKTGGRVVSLEFSTPTSPLLKHICYLYLDYWVPFLGKLVAGEEAYRLLSDSIQGFPHQREIRELFEKAGLGDTVYFELTGGIATVHVGVV